MSATIEKVLSLKLEGKNLLKGELANEDGNPVDSTLDLNIYVENLDGNFSWGGRGNFSLTAKDIKLEGNTLIATLQRRNQEWTTQPQRLNLAERIYNVNGHLTYLEHEPAPDPESGVGLELEGNIDGRTFAVASDVANNICRVAYKTVFNDKISFAEVKFDGTLQRWGLPKEIDVYSTQPGQNITLAIDPVDTTRRSLFFSEEDGNGYIYRQEFLGQKWGEPKQISNFKAHRFSKFAATTYVVTDTKLFLLYYVDESNSLREIVGAAKKSGNHWTAKWTATTVVQEVPPNTFLAVSQRKDETVLIFRDTDRNVSLVRTKATSVRNEDNDYRADWTRPSVILTADKLLKHSPLAIVHRSNGQLLTFFYVNRSGRDKLIYSLDYLPGKTFAPKNVGKLESESILGAASFPNIPAYDARLLSVSNLDGDDILLDRIPKFIGRTQYWVAAGGLVDTDVDGLTPRSVA